MSENKTIPTSLSVEAFLETITDAQKREDSFTLLHLMQKITGEPPVMWGTSLIGFGKVHYKYKTGREGDIFHTGFSPRVQNLTVYIMPGFDRYEELMQRLGKFKTGKSCLYFKKLSDIDLEVLTTLISLSSEHTKTYYNH